MDTKKAIKIISIVTHVFAFALGATALGLISCAFAKADYGAISSYLALKLNGDMSQTATYQQFLEALQLGGIYKHAVTSCCMGLGACMSSLIANILGVVANVDRKGNR